MNYKRLLRALLSYTKTDSVEGLEEVNRLYEKLLAYINKSQKEHELLGLYRLQQEFQEKYNTEERLIQKMRCLDELREIKEELDALEKEIEEMAE